MKILTVRFKNINSLTGEWFIDLTDQHYVSSGIFAIVGATGAGKSTILDAISLALYGRTPRLSQISKSSNQIMSRQKGDCFSEVEFLSVKGHFRAHWSQHKARRSSTGELQPPRHEFVDAATNKVLSTKIRDVALDVIRATGMNFDQFTRSMLLAQGEFAKFLQASADQRSPILEQITGSEIYSRISQQVHQRTTEEEKRVDRLEQQLEGVTLLSETELSHYQGRRQEINSSLEKLHATIAGSNTILNWHQSLETLTTDLLQQKKVQESIEQEWETDFPQRQQLSLAEKCDPLMPLYSQLENERRLLLEEKQALEQTRKKKEEATSVLGLLQKKLEASKKEYKLHQSEVKKTETIIKEVKQLDYICEKTSKEAKEHQYAIAADEKNFQQQKEEDATLQRSIADAKKHLEETQDFLQKNLQDQELQESLAGIKEKCTLLQQKKDSYRETTAQIETLDTRIKSLESQKNELLKTVETALSSQKQTQSHLDLINEQIAQLGPHDLSQLYTSLHEKKEHLQKLHDGTTLLTQVQEQTKHSEEHKERVRGNSVQLSSLDKALGKAAKICSLHRINVAKQEEIVLLANKIESFEEERRKLQNGVACPLCGATEHPFSDPNRIHTSKAQQELEKLKQQLHAEEEKAKTLETQIVGLKIERKNSEDDQEQSNALLTKYQKELRHLCENLKLPQDDTLPTHIGDAIQRTTDGINELETLVEELATLMKKKSQAEEDLKKLVQDGRECENRFQQENHALTGLVAERKVKLASLDRLKNELKSLGGEVTKMTLPYFAVTIAETEIPPLIAQLKARVETWKQKNSTLIEQDKKLQTLEHKQEQLRLTGTHLEQAITTKKLKLSQLLKEHVTTSSRRSALFGSKSPRKVEKTLSEKTTSLEQQLEHNKTAHTVKERELVALRERFHHLERSHTDRGGLVEQKKKQFIERIQGIDLDSEEAFARALVPEKERIELHAKISAANTRRLETKTAIDNLQRQLDKERAKALSQKPVDEIRQELSEQSKKLNQLQQELGALNSTLENNTRAEAEHRVKRQELRKQKSEFGYWKQLHLLIGSSDGKKFRNFAQGLTFEQMIVQANKTLLKLSDRYLLKRSPDHPLELNVIDAYQAGEIRSTANLSGGESFIISLALALALSAMASDKVQVDSLFLDEGFGTLDEDSLEIALETLSNLQQSGKLIGIISHVPLLKERIGVQLQLTAGLDGTSKISGPGVECITA